MEFNFNIQKVIGNEIADGIVFLNGSSADEYNKKDLNNISALLDKIGALSATVYKKM